MKAESSGFSVKDVLFIIGMLLHTGELVLESENNIGTMLLHEGKVLGAYFSLYSRAIGDLLVEDGIIHRNGIAGYSEASEKECLFNAGDGGCF